MNLMLVGEESAGIQLLRAFKLGSHRVAAVMTSPSGTTNGCASLWQVARNMGLRTWPSKLVKDPCFAEVIRSERIDILLNVHSLYIIRKEVIAAPRIGSFNLHPGPLPRYAGLNTVSWALYGGASAYGVTLHRMEAEIDTGAIAYRAVFPIDDNDTALSLYTKCIRAGLPLIMRLLEAASYGEGAIPAARQDLSRRRYFGKGRPQEGRIDWGRPAREIFNFVRACDYHPFPSPWGYPAARFGEREAAVAKAALTGRSCGAPAGALGGFDGPAVLVACADEWLLIRKLMVDDQPVDAAAVLGAGGGEETRIPEEKDIAHEQSRGTV